MFSAVPVKFLFSLGLKLLRSYCLCEWRFGRLKVTVFEEVVSKHFFCYGSLRSAFTLRLKYTIRFTLQTNLSDFLSDSSETFFCWHYQKNFRKSCNFCTNNLYEATFKKEKERKKPFGISHASVNKTGS